MSFRSGLWLSHSNTWNSFFSNPFFCRIALMLRITVMMKIQPRNRSNFRTECKTHLFKIAWYITESIMPSMRIILPFSTAAKHHQIPLFKILSFLPKSYSLVPSDHKIFCQNISSLSICPLT